MINSYLKPSSYWISSSHTASYLSKEFSSHFAEGHPIHYTSSNFGELHSFSKGITSMESVPTYIFSCFLQAIPFKFDLISSLASLIFLNLPSLRVLAYLLSKSSNNLGASYWSHFWRSSEAFLSFNRNLDLVFF